jgi:hypothetical protein
VDKKDKERKTGVVRWKELQEGESEGVGRKVVLKFLPGDAAKTELSPKFMKLRIQSK